MIKSVLWLNFQKCQKLSRGRAETPGRKLLQGFRGDMMVTCTKKFSSGVSELKVRFYIYIEGRVFKGFNRSNIVFKIEQSRMTPEFWTQ